MGSDQNLHIGPVSLDRTGAEQENLYQSCIWGDKLLNSGFWKSSEYPVDSFLAAWFSTASTHNDLLENH